MKRLACPACASRVYFEQLRCPVCSTEFAFVPAMSTVTRLDESVTSCRHRAVIDCNWTTEPGEPFCAACRLNRIVPNLSQAGNVERWRRIERAKRRLVVDLLRLRLPIVSRSDDP
ncbi:MAG TPA: zinc-ribbon domain-containing protein, partial [Chthoniobacterales bacterium]